MGNAIKKRKEKHKPLLESVLGFNHVFILYTSTHYLQNMRQNVRMKLYTYIVNLAISFISSVKCNVVKSPPERSKMSAVGVHSMFRSVSAERCIFAVFQATK